MPDGDEGLRVSIASVQMDHPRAIMEAIQQSAGPVPVFSTSLGPEIQVGLTTGRYELGEDGSLWGWVQFSRHPGAFSIITGETLHAVILTDWSMQLILMAGLKAFGGGGGPPPYD